MTKEIVPTTEDHVIELANTIREADRQEIWASSHREPYQAIMLGVKLSDEPFTGLMDGKVVCIFGVSQISPFSEVARPWLLASDLIEDTVHTFLRVNKVYIREIKKRYPFLENYVDCRNVQAMKWLKWLGFKFDNPKPYGPDNLLFCRFEIRKE